MDLVYAIVEGMHAKKASQVTVLDLRSVAASVSDYLVMCCAPAKPNVEAIVDAIQEHTQEKVYELPWHMEATPQTGWVVLDYGNVVAHVFLPQQWDFYDLRALFGDIPCVDLSAKAPVDV